MGFDTRGFLNRALDEVRKAQRLHQPHKIGRGVKNWHRPAGRDWSVFGHEGRAKALPTLHTHTRQQRRHFDRAQAKLGASKLKEEARKGGRFLDVDWRQVLEFQRARIKEEGL